MIMISYLDNKDIIQPPAHIRDSQWIVGRQEDVDQQQGTQVRQDHEACCQPEHTQRLKATM